MSDTQPALYVSFSEGPQRGRFSLLDEESRALGEMTFRRGAVDLIEVDHTEVDGSLRGMGAGRLLFDAMVRWAREHGVRVTATCGFTRSMFERDPSSRDVLA